MGVCVEACKLMCGVQAHVPVHKLQLYCLHAEFLKLLQSGVSTGEIKLNSWPVCVVRLERVASHILWL